MTLDRPVFDLQDRIRHWLASLSDEEKHQLRRMDPQESLRFLMRGLDEVPSPLGSPR